MYYSRLSVLQDCLTAEQIKKLDAYFSSLIGSTRNNITVSKLANQINIPISLSVVVLTKCKKNNILDVAYSVRCPNCGMLINKESDLQNIPLGSFECYSCENEIEVNTNCIELIYSLKEDDESVFIKGQQKNKDASARFVAPENSMDSIFKAGGVNEYFFHPKDKDYQRLDTILSRVMHCKGENKEKGDKLEDFVIELFNLCPVFKAAGINTQLNQIDCCVRNKMYIDYGVLKTIGLRFYIECKNENKTPSGSYISKLHSIITETNSNGAGVKFGIIISKNKCPSTYKYHAVKYYLSQQIIVISLCCAELKLLIKAKGNLLELIERKSMEIILDSKTDLVEAGLYNI